MLARTEAYGLQFCFPEGDETIGPCLRDFGEFSKVELELAAAYLDLVPTGSILDIGANVGSIAVPLAQRFPDAKVLAVEGHAGIAQILGHNAFSNDLTNLQVVHAVAGSTSQLFRFPATSLDAKGNWGSIGVGDLGRGLRETNVRMCTIDELAGADTRLIKIDTEGFEEEVLKGATRTLSRVRPVFMIETATNYPVASRATIAIMLAAGYDVYWLFVPFLTHTAVRGGHPGGLTGDFNILAVPNGGPNLWDLQPVLTAEDPYPTALIELPYLRRFGFTHSKWAPA